MPTELCALPLGWVVGVFCTRDCEVPSSAVTVSSMALGGGGVVASFPLILCIKAMGCMATGTAAEHARRRPIADPSIYAIPPTADIGTIGRRIVTIGEHGPDEVHGRGEEEAG